MCRSRAEGGQRCYTHALARLDRTEQKYDDAMAQLRSVKVPDGATEPPPALRRAYETVGRASDAYLDAAIDFASTERGHQALTETVAIAGNQGRAGSAASTYVIALVEGPARRAARQAALRRHRETGEPADAVLDDLDEVRHRALTRQRDDDAHTPRLGVY